MIAIMWRSKMSPTPEIEPQTTFFLAKWSVEIALGLIGLLTAYILKVYGSKADVITQDQLKICKLELRQEIMEELGEKLSVHENNIKEYIKEIIEAHEK